MTVQRAVHIHETLGVDVFDEDSLFDYLTGFASAVAVTHAIMHMLDDDPDMPCVAMIMGALANCLPLLPMVPMHLVRGQG